MTKPITPKEVSSLKLETIPEKVIEAFNELIAKGWDGNRSVVFQRDVAALIVKKMELPNNAAVYRNHWLDVEDIYMKAGWIVDYDKPGYCESYEATFTFKKKPTRA